MTILEIISNDYFMALYAVVVWYGFLFVIDKEPADAKNGDFKITRWFKKTWDNIGLTFLVAPWCVIYHEEILWLFNHIKDDEFDPIAGLINISAGPLVSAIIKFIKYFIKNG